MEGYHNLDWVGREEIRNGVIVSAIAEVEFTTPVTIASDGVFTCAVEFRGGGFPFVADVEFEVGDELITRMHQVDERVTAGSGE